jgi:hypothetical protein
VNALLHDEDVLLWREIASILVSVVVLSILFFTLLGRGRYVGEGGMQYFPFLMFALAGLGICTIIYHTVGLLEKALFLSSIFSISRHYSFRCRCICWCMLYLHTPIFLSGLSLTTSFESAPRKCNTVHPSGRRCRG